VGMAAGRDVAMGEGSRIEAQSAVKLAAKRNVNIANSSILVTNSSQLRMLSEMDPGQLKIDAERGNILVTDSSLEAAQVLVESPRGNITFNNTFMSADVIKARTLANNGTITIGGMSTLSATDLIRLYAEGSNGMIHFTGPASLNASKVDLAAKTVRVNAGVDVNVSNPEGLSIYTNKGQFSNSGANGYGRFTSGGVAMPVNQQTFDKRPAY